MCLLYNTYLSKCLVDLSLIKKSVLIIFHIIRLNIYEKILIPYKIWCEVKYFSIRNINPKSCENVSKRSCLINIVMVVNVCLIASQIYNVWKKCNLQFILFSSLTTYLKINSTIVKLIFSKLLWYFIKWFCFKNNQISIVIHWWELQHMTFSSKSPNWKAFQQDTRNINENRLTIKWAIDFYFHNTNEKLSSPTVTGVVLLLQMHKLNRKSNESFSTNTQVDSVL